MNVTEIYMGMRPGERAKTEKLLRSLEFYSVTWEVAQLAGDLFRRWRQKGQTLSYTDVTIAAVAVTHGLVLVTDNQNIFRCRSCRSSRRLSKGKSQFPRAATARYRRSHLDEPTSPDGIVAGRGLLRSLFTKSA